MALWNNKSTGSVTILEQVTMLHGDMVKHIPCNPLGANGAGRGVGLVGVVLLEVDAEGCDVMVLVAVGAGDPRPRRVPELQRHLQLHLHVPVVLHLHLHLFRPHPGHIVDAAELRRVVTLGGGQARDPVLRVHVSRFGFPPTLARAPSRVLRCLPQAPSPVPSS